MRSPRFLLHSQLLLLGLGLYAAIVFPLLAGEADGESPVAQEEPPGIQVGQPLPEEALKLELVDFSTQRAPLSSLVGEHGTLVVFTANTCPYSIDWIDRFPRLATFSQQHDISFFLVNSNARKRTSDDSPEAMQAVAEENGFDFPYLVDEGSRLATAFGATRTPEVFLFDGALKLVYRGAIDDLSGPFEMVTQPWTAVALRQMIEGEEITTPRTPALGCSVQWPRRGQPPKTRLK